MKTHYVSVKMAIKSSDAEKIRQMFEEGLKRVQKLDRIDRMKMRSKIRREITLVCSWRSPKTDVIMARWESRLSDAFSLFPHRFKDDLIHLIAEIIQKE